MNSIYSSLRTFYKTLELYELSAKIELAKMPPWSPSTVEQQEVMKLFSRDSIVRAYLADKKKQKIDEFIVDRNHLLILFLFSTGLRRSEAANAKHADLKLDRKVPVIETRGKGGKVRVVELHAHWLQLYTEFCKKYGQHEFIFYNKSIAKFREQTLTNMVKHIAKINGVGGVTGLSPHRARHFYATYLIEHGTEITKVQRNLGHENLNTTSRYNDLVLDSDRRIENPLDKLVK